MKCLVIGGTRFLGRWIVEEALARGWEVTLFNRGNHPDVFPNVRTMIGDRDVDLHKLERENWDLVIDTCGFHPDTVHKSVNALKANTSFYVFISTISVYARFAYEDEIKEDNQAILTLTKDELSKLALNNQTVGDYYGHLKYLSEQEVINQIPDHALIVRPGLIVGPYDPTDRFTYWALRLKEKRPILAPGRRDKKIQFIDVRDLAAWVVKMAEARNIGTFNATGPESLYSMENLIEDGKEVFNNDSPVKWVSEKFLLKEDIQPWVELPLWIPETTPDPNGQKDRDSKRDNGVSIEAALSYGLTCRSPKDTLRDTNTWFKNEGRALEKAGLARETEVRLLQKWKQEQSDPVEKD